MRWQHGDKTSVLRVAHHMFLVGDAFLGVAMTTAVFVVSGILLGGLAALAAAAVGGILIGVTWYALPLHHRFRPGPNE
jgi:hypothetical protein